MQKKKKVLAFLFIFLLFFAKTFSIESKNYFEYPEPLLEASLSYGFNSQEGFETYISFLQPFVYVNTSHFSAFTGMQINKGSFDFTSSGIFWPFHTERLRVGLGLDYHYNYYDAVSRTNDFIINTYFQTRPFQKFGIDLSLGYLFKARTIFAIEDYKPILWSRCPAISIKANFYPVDSVNLFFKASSYEAFRYFIFLAPSFTFGTKVCPKDSKLFIAYDVTFRYVDFFTLSTYFDGKEYRLTIGLKL